MVRNTKSEMAAPIGKARTGTATVVAIAMLTSAGLLTGCANVSKTHMTVGSVPDDYRTRHPIVISENEKTADIPVASDAIKLDRVAQGVAMDMAERFRKDGSGSIRIMKPVGSANEHAAHKLAHQVRHVLLKNRVHASQIIEVPYAVNDTKAAAPIRLSYMNIQAKAGECGKWPDDLSNDTENRNYHNFGCATQNNLAAMIANPADLLGPRRQSEIDATRRSDVLEKYRTGERTRSFY